MGLKNQNLNRQALIGLMSEMRIGWMIWPITHTITPSYVLSEKQLRKHAWNANAWVIRRHMKKNEHK